MISRNNYIDFDLLCMLDLFASLNMDPASTVDFNTNWWCEYERQLQYSG